MECGRRNRRCNRRNCRQQASAPSPCRVSPCRAKPWSCLSGLASFLIMSSLMALIYLMLEYHCETCNAKCSMNCIKKNIDDIAKNLSHLRNSYQGLEQQISRFSQELPRLEGQIEILETLANTLERNELGLGWDPKNHFTLPNVDVYLAKTGCNGKNISRLVKPVTYVEGCRNATCLKRKMERTKNAVCF